MARPLRVEYPGAWYHVINRGAGRRQIFRTDQHRRLFLELCGESSDTFGIEVHAYCLMGNHYHLLVHTPQGNLSRAMRHLNGVYTQRYNRSAKTDGPLFRGRYKAILVDADSYLLQVSRYIHRNPLEARLIEQLGRYPWSSYPAYIGKAKGAPWLRTQTVLAMLAQRSRQARYKAYVEAGMDEEVAEFYGKFRVSPILGSDAFKEQILAGLDVDETEVPDRHFVQPRPEIAEIIRAVSQAFGMSPEEIAASRRGRGRRNTARAVAIRLCRRPGGHTLKEIAAAFGLGHYSAVTVAIYRLEQELSRDVALESRIKTLAGELVD